jgi:hypothetical protein
MRIAVFAATILGLGVNAACADAIDGDWCNEVDGSHLRIDGATIELGSGVSLKGDYARHAFRYVAPEGSPEAGAMIEFILRSENQMRRVRTPDAMPEHEDLWRRCQPIS